MSRPAVILRAALWFTGFGAIAVLVLPLYLARYGMRAWAADFASAAADFLATETMGRAQ